MIIVVFLLVTLTTTLTYTAVNVADRSSTQTTTTTTPASTTSSTTSQRAPPSVDGFSQASYGSTTCVDTLTTANPDDVLVVFAGQERAGPAVGVADASGLVWHYRDGAAFTYLGALGDSLDEWYATSVSPLTADNITVTYTDAGSIACSARGISGAAIASPFDPSAGCAAETGVPQAASSSPEEENSTMTVCTSGQGDLLVGALWLRGGGLVSAPDDFTQIAGGGDLSFSEAYRQVPTSQPGLAVEWAFGGDSWAMVTDAIASGSP